MELENMTVGVDVDIDTEPLDEMNEKLETAVDNADDLQEALNLPSIVIRGSRHCTFNININQR